MPLRKLVKSTPARPCCVFSWFVARCDSRSLECRVERRAERRVGGSGGGPMESRVERRAGRRVDLRRECRGEQFDGSGQRRDSARRAETASAIRPSPSNHALKSALKSAPDAAFHAAFHTVFHAALDTAADATLARTIVATSGASPSATTSSGCTRPSCAARAAPVPHFPPPKSPSAPSPNRLPLYSPPPFCPAAPDERFGLSVDPLQTHILVIFPTDRRQSGVECPLPSPSGLRCRR